MRADRLISLLFMLQRSGKVTTRQVAEELEVSTRTARRDLEALAMAGVPVYSQSGRNGGWFLLGGGSTDLTGFNEPEAKALVLAATTALGADPMLKTALRKLVAALPQPFQEAADVATVSIISDTEAWGMVGRRSDATRPAHFDTVSDALLASKQLNIGYLNNNGDRSDRVISPLGLIEKTGRWYLVGSQSDLNGLAKRTFRLDRITSSAALDTPAVRPSDFNLPDEWEQINENFNRYALTITARGTTRDNEAVPHLKRLIGNRLNLSQPNHDDTIGFEIRGWTNDSLAREVAAFGDMIEIKSPPEVLDLLRELGRQISNLYSSPEF